VPILVSSKEFKTETFVGLDSFDSVYHIENNTLYKLNELSNVNYSNLQLGKIIDVNIFNTLKILVFYKNFNTVIVLDNRLAEIFKIDFNSLSPFKNVSHISAGFDNTLWLFNTEKQQLELFDYKKGATKLITLPVQSSVLDLTSNYNYCWLLTENHLYKYNYMGSLLLKIKNDGYRKIKQSNANLFLQKNDSLFYLSNKSQFPVPLPLGELLIKQFSVTNETLYIYDANKLHEFQLTIN